MPASIVDLSCCCCSSAGPWLPSNIYTGGLGYTGVSPSGPIYTGGYLAGASSRMGGPSGSVFPGGPRTGPEYTGSWQPSTSYLGQAELGSYMGMRRQPLIGPPCGVRRNAPRHHGLPIHCFNSQLAEHRYTLLPIILIPVLLVHSGHLVLAGSQCPVHIVICAADHGTHVPLFILVTSSTRPQSNADLLDLEKLTLTDKEALFVVFSVHNTPKHFRSTLAQLMVQFTVHGLVRRISPNAVRASLTWLKFLNLY